MQLSEPEEEEMTSKNSENKDEERQQTLLAKTILFLVSGLALVEGVLNYFFLRDVKLGSFNSTPILSWLIAVIVCVVSVIAFLILGTRFNRNPYRMIRAGFILYVLLTGLELVNATLLVSSPDGSHFHLGWILKLLIILGLVNGLRRVRNQTVELKSKRGGEDEILDSEWMNTL